MYSPLRCHLPEITSGKERQKTEKDYQNLLYDLNSCQAFNRNLIKGIAKEHLEPLSGSKDEKSTHYFGRKE